MGTVPISILVAGFARNAVDPTDDIEVGVTRVDAGVDDGDINVDGIGMRPDQRNGIAVCLRATYAGRPVVTERPYPKVRCNREHVGVALKFLELARRDMRREAADRRTVHVAKDESVLVCFLGGF